MNDVAAERDSGRPADGLQVGFGPACAWVLLDWGASAFSTILITLVVTYAERVVYADAAWGVPAGVVWAWIIAAAMVVSALLAPWLSARADRSGGHQRAVAESVVAGTAGCVLLALVPSDARVAVAARARWGLSVAGALRMSFVVMAVWWLGFSLPAFLTRMGDPRPARGEATGIADLFSFARSLVGAEALLGRVFVGAALVTGAVQTAISQFSSLAIEEFHMEAPAVVRLVLIVQLVALPGALAMGWASTRWSRLGVLGVCIAGWVAVCVLGWFVETPRQLTWLAVLLALVLGGVQSVVRAIVAVLAPEGRHGVTFGVFQVGTKLAGCVASLLFGAMYAVSGLPRAGGITLVVQLLVGWWLVRGAAIAAEGGGR